jgi:hypothetical protein
LSATTVKNLTVQGLNFQYSDGCISSAAMQVVANSDTVLIQNSSITWNNATGLGLNSGTHITVQNVAANHNGGGGFGAYHLKNVNFQKDEGSFNNWRGHQGQIDLWDAAGGKFLLVHDSTFTSFTAFNNLAPGLWFDTDNLDITVNAAYLTGNEQTALFVEDDEGPITIGQSKICGNGGGILDGNSANVKLSGNLFYNNNGSQINASGDAGGRGGSNWETGQNFTLFDQNWTITQNTIVAAGSSQVAAATTLGGSDWTQYATTLAASLNQFYDASGTQIFQMPGGQSVDLPGWRQATGQDQNSTFGAPAVDPAISCATPPSPVKSACDLNGDGVVNQTDVQLCVNQAFGVLPCTTCNFTGDCSVLDVQSVINGALGANCP